MHNQEVIELIKNRRSVRSYKNDMLTDEEMMVLEKVMINVPTHHNTQKVHFSVVTDKELLDEMAEIIRQIMLNGNEAQAKKANTPGYSPLHHAPVVIFVSGELSADFHVQTECGVAAGELVMAAAAMGVESCITASSAFMFRDGQGEAIKKKLGIPDNYHTVISVALGYLEGEKPEQPEKTQKVIHITG